MTKKSSERLQVVLKLAQIKQRQAAERLAQAAQNLQSNRSQGEQLRLYQGEYNQHFHSYENQPVTGQKMRNYQRFFGGLEEAVYTQDQRSVFAETQFDFHRGQWQESYGREKNMAKLVDRKRADEDKALDKKEQLVLDDRVSAYTTLHSE